mmetsp:Transcript_5816/g.22985  ORF Transcript_5816/g.22985 Transcript_5816/m.22985 type:complete len:279 (+) Transcript_5816:2692-3528(+)
MHLSHYRLDVLRIPRRRANHDDVRAALAHELEASIEVGAPLAQHDRLVRSLEVFVWLFESSDLVRQCGQCHDLGKLPRGVANHTDHRVFRAVACDHCHDPNIAVVRCGQGRIAGVLAVAVRRCCRYEPPELLPDLGRDEVARDLQHALAQLALEGLEQHVHGECDCLLALVIPRLSHGRLAVAEIRADRLEVGAKRLERALVELDLNLKQAGLDALLNQQRTRGQWNAHLRRAIHVMLLFGPVNYEGAKVSARAVVPLHEQVRRLASQPFDGRQSVVV